MSDYYTDSLLIEIRQNKSKLNGCKRHKFDLNIPFQVGQKYECKNCGGRESGPAILVYCQGYKAAGGNPNDIVENFE